VTRPEFVRRIRALLERLPDRVAAARDRGDSALQADLEEARVLLAKAVKP
jgi:hypothetical protein